MPQEKKPTADEVVRHMWFGNRHVAPLKRLFGPEARDADPTAAEGVEAGTRTFHPFKDRLTDDEQAWLLRPKSPTRGQDVNLPAPKGKAGDAARAAMQRAMIIKELGEGAPEKIDADQESYRRQVAHLEAERRKKEK